MNRTDGGRLSTVPEAEPMAGGTELTEGREFRAWRSQGGEMHHSASRLDPLRGEEDPLEFGRRGFQCRQLAGQLVDGSRGCIAFALAFRKRVAQRRRRSPHRGRRRQATKPSVAKEAKIPTPSAESTPKMGPEVRRDRTTVPATEARMIQKDARAKGLAV